MENNMSRKLLDDIVLDDEVKERIRLLFEQATASGTVSFEHDWQWNAYCDVLYGFAGIQKAISSYERKERNKLDLINEDSRDRYYAEDYFKHIVQEEITLLETSLAETLSLISEEIQSLPHYSSEVLRVLLDTAFPHEFVVRIGEYQRNSYYMDEKREAQEKFVREQIRNQSFDGYSCDYLGETIFEVKDNIKKRISFANSHSEKMVCFYNEAGNWSDYFFSLPDLDDEERVALKKFLTGKEHVDKKERSLKVLSRKEYSASSSVSRIPEAIECAEIEIDNYAIIKKIGEGSGRIAYKAWDEKDECYVAVKVAKKNGGTDQSSNRKEQIEEYGEEGLAKKEGHAARQLSHKNIVRYFWRGMTDDGRAYVVEEYVEGLTLETFIDLVVKENKQWALREPAPLMLEQLLEGVAYLHEEGYVHRDIKPGNILIPDIFRYYGQDWVQKYGELRLGDLELTRRIKYSDVIKGAHGARAYTAPEVLAGIAVSYASDVFSLGIVMYETFTQKHPFVFQKTDKDDKEKITTNISKDYNYPGIHTQIASSAEIPEEYKSIIDRCLRYDPRERFQNAGEIIEQLQKARTDRKKRKKRKRAGIVTGALIGIAACALAAWQIPTYLEQRRVEADKRTAEETYQLAEDLQRAEKSPRPELIYVKDEDIIFLYRVASNIDPSNIRAKEQVCIREAGILLDNIVLQEARAYGVEDLYLIDSVKKGIFFKRKGQATDIIFPDLHDTIAICEQAISKENHFDYTAFSSLSGLYRLSGDLRHAIDAQREYVKAIMLSKDDKATYAAKQDLAKLLMENGELEEAEKIGKDTLGVKIALALQIKDEQSEGSAYGHKYHSFDSAEAKARAVIHNIEEARNKERNNNLGDITDEELAELYYLYGYACLFEHRVHPEGNYERVSLFYKIRKDEKEGRKIENPSLLDDAESALLNAIVLDETKATYYFLLAEVYKKKENDTEQKRAIKIAEQLKSLQEMQERELEVYATVYPYEISRDILQPMGLRSGELCNPYVHFSWYLKQHEPQTMIGCVPAFFSENFKWEGSIEAPVSVWYGNNNNTDTDMFIDITLIDRKKEFCEKEHCTKEEIVRYVSLVSDKEVRRLKDQKRTVNFNDGYLGSSYKDHNESKDNRVNYKEIKKQ